MRLKAKMAAFATMHQLQVDSDRRLRRRRLSLLSLLRRQATLLLLSTALLCRRRATVSAGEQSGESSLQPQVNIRAGQVCLRPAKSQNTAEVALAQLAVLAYRGTHPRIQPCRATELIFQEDGEIRPVPPGEAAPAGWR